MGWVGGCDEEDGGGLIWRIFMQDGELVRGVGFASCMSFPGLDSRFLPFFWVFSASSSAHGVLEACFRLSSRPFLLSHHRARSSDKEAFPFFFCLFLCDSLFLSGIPGMSGRLLGILGGISGFF